MSELDRVSFRILPTLVHIIICKVQNKKSNHTINVCTSVTNKIIRNGSCVTDQEAGTEVTSTVLGWSGMEYGC